MPSNIHTSSKHGIESHSFVHEFITMNCSHQVSSVLSSVFKDEIEIFENDIDEFSFVNGDFEFVDINHAVSFFKLLAFAEILQFQFPHVFGSEMVEEGEDDEDFFGQDGSVSVQ